jgi:hypothetical protein
MAANVGEGASRVFSVAGGDTETSTGDDAEASTGDDTEASAGDDIEASTGGTSIVTSLIRFTPKTPGTSTKDFEVDLLRVERGSVAQTFL